jgi:hypothetical protein
MISNIHAIELHKGHCLLYYATVRRVAWGKQNGVGRRHLSRGEISVESNIFVTGKQSQNLLSTVNTQYPLYRKYA